MRCPRVSKEIKCLSYGMELLQYFKKVDSMLKHL
jgi:hypothetical protein